MAVFSFSNNFIVWLLIISLSTKMEWKDNILKYEIVYINAIYHEC